MKQRGHFHELSDCLPSGPDSSLHHPLLYVGHVYVCLRLTAAPALVLNQA